MDRQQRAALDRHITGNYGEDQFPKKARKPRGFAAMTMEARAEIASKGGKAAHAKGTAHEFDSDEARKAGRKGGVSVSRNLAHMAAIGRKGGEARGRLRNDNGNGVTTHEQT